MSTSTLAWIVTRTAPDSLFVELKKIPAADKQGLLKLLLRAERKGWVKLLGNVKGTPADVAAVIQEHFDTRPVRMPKRKGARHGKKG